MDGVGLTSFRLDRPLASPLVLSSLATSMPSLTRLELMIDERSCESHHLLHLISLKSLTDLHLTISRCIVNHLRVLSLVSHALTRLCILDLDTRPTSRMTTISDGGDQKIKSDNEIQDLLCQKWLTYLLPLRLLIHTVISINRSVTTAKWVVDSLATDPFTIHIRTRFISSIWSQFNARPFQLRCSAHEFPRLLRTLLSLSSSITPTTIKPPKIRHQRR
jgi:hypothetical protein